MMYLLNNPRHFKNSAMLQQKQTTGRDSKMFINNQETILLSPAMAHFYNE